MLVRSGIILVKYWFSVSDAEQERRFQARIDDPTKRWKLSPMDLMSRTRWVEYSMAKDEMFRHTDIKQAPWYVVNGDDKKRARLNVISHLLSLIPYEDLTPEPIVAAAAGAGPRLRPAADGRADVRARRSTEPPAAGAGDREPRCRPRARGSPLAAAPGRAPPAALRRAARPAGERRRWQRARDSLGRAPHAGRRSCGSAGRVRRAARRSASSSPGRASASGPAQAVGRRATRRPPRRGGTSARSSGSRSCSAHAPDRLARRTARSPGAGASAAGHPAQPVVLPRDARGSASGRTRAAKIARRRPRRPRPRRRTAPTWSRS